MLLLFVVAIIIVVVVCGGGVIDVSVDNVSATLVGGAAVVVTIVWVTVAFMVAVRLNNSVELFWQQALAITW